MSCVRSNTEFKNSILENGPEIQMELSQLRCNTVFGIAYGVAFPFVDCSCSLAHKTPFCSAEKEHFGLLITLLMVQDQEM